MLKTGSLDVGDEIPNNHSITKRRELMEKKENGQTQVGRMSKLSSK